jgi:hypothetical protein
LIVRKARVHGQWQRFRRMPSILPVLLRALAVWLVIIMAESVQGGLRRLLFSPEAAFVARQVSVLTGTAVIFAITWLAMRWMRIRTAAGALLVGVAWSAATFGFEIAAGRALGAGWTRIWSDYDLRHGGLMPLGLVLMAVTPWAVQRLQGRAAARRPRA